MKLFGGKNKKEIEEVPVKESKAVEVVEPKKTSTKKQTPNKTAPKSDNNLVRSTDRNLSSVLIKPRASEKAYYATEKNVYVFEVRMGATKHDVRDAINAKYSITPKKINITKKSPRRFMSRNRGQLMNEKGLKKAYVYLRDGDKIDLV